MTTCFSCPVSAALAQSQASLSRLAAKFGAYWYRASGQIAGGLGSLLVIALAALLLATATAMSAVAVAAPLIDFVPMLISGLSR